MTVALSRIDRRQQPCPAAQWPHEDPTMRPPPGTGPYKASGRVGGIAAFSRPALPPRTRPNLLSRGVV